VNEIILTSGIGQFHTNEPDPAKPDKKLTPYLTIGMGDIRAMVDNPQQVDKTQAQWLIPSSVPSRHFKTQEEQGQFFMLWADLDKNPPTLIDLAATMESVLGGADYESYNTKSATVENQKARLLIPLAVPLSGKEWLLAQGILNDKLEALGITPDRKNEGAGQLCYLPNRGEFYESISKRGGEYV
jgi:hypothetical protein